MTANERIIEASIQKHIGTRDLSAFATEYANHECEIDDNGDIWDSRGHWWNDVQKLDFLNWLDKR